MAHVRAGCALLLSVAVACHASGFKEVEDAGQDGAPGSDLRVEGHGDAAADASLACSQLASIAGPILLGYGESGSLVGATVATSTHLASVWERYYSGSGELFFAVQDRSGKIVRKALVLDQSEYPPVPAMIAINGQFGVVHVRREQDQELQYLLVDAEGTTVKKQRLVSGLGQYLAEPTVAAGPSGIAVGYTRYESDETGQVYLGKIDENGAVTRGFAPLGTTGMERRQIQLVATDAGFAAVWIEPRGGDLWAVLASRLDGSLSPVTPPGVVVVAEDAQAHRRPAVLSVGRDLLVCYESLDPGQDADIGCRTVKEDGTLGSTTTSTLVGLSGRRPQLVAVGDRVALIWTGVTTGLEEVHVRLLAEDGSALADSRRISEPGVRSWNPSVAWDGESVVAGWYRYIPITVHFASFRLGCEGS